MAFSINWRNEVKRPNIVWYKGLIDVNGLVQLTQSWMEENHFLYTEKQYKHKVPSPKGAEEDFYCYGVRKMDAYVRFQIHVRWKAWDLQEVEVIRDGKKVKMHKGRIRLELWPVLDLDYKGAFETSRFMEKLRKFYNDYIVKKEIDTIWGDYIYYIALKLHAEIKKFLNMEASSNIYVTRW